MPGPNHPRLLFAGPMLGKHAGWVPNPAEMLAQKLAARGWNCQLTSQVVNRYVRGADMLVTLVRRRADYDVVCLQMYSGASFIIQDLVSGLAQRLGKRLVMVLHGGGLPEFTARHPGWSRRVLRRAAQIVAPSGFLAEAAHTLGFSAVVIPNALALEQYPFRLRERVGPKLLWMRTFHPIYHPHMAVEVLSKMYQILPQSVLTMAGQERGELASTRQLAAQLGVSAKVRFLGFLNLDAKQGEFSTHDIFLNTNHVDNMPVSVIEAAAFGLPVVATAVGGVPYLIKSGENGLLVEDGDSAGMAAAAARLVLEEGLAQKFSARGRELAEQCDWSRILPQWEILLSGVAHG